MELSAKDRAEIKAASPDWLRGAIRLMNYQIGAKLLVGDRARPVAVKAACEAELAGRAGA